MDSIFQSLGKLGQGFNALTFGKKMSVLAVLFITAAGIGLMIYFTSQIEYRVLFSNLTAEDAGNIVGKLNENKIPYKISSTGTAISVPSDKVSELRLEMAAAGLPQGSGVGFEIFDSKKLGITEFEQQLNYRRALQGELARTINGLDEIQSCRVHIALPKESLFADQQKKPSASVTLKMKSGRMLRPAQVEGIVHLVASSIEGMSPEDVMVVDSKGAILSGQRNESKLSKLTSSQIDFQRNTEKELAGRIQSMLENVVGKGKAVVRVTAELDFRVMEKTEETYDAEAPVVRSVQRNTEKVAAVGKAGAGAETPEKEKLDEIVNYEINKVINKTVMPVGETKKISIAVLVDGTYKKNEKGELAYQPRTKEEIESIEELVRKSSGFNAQRGDQVVVTNMPFGKEEVEEAEKLSLKESVETFTPLLGYLIIAGAVLFILLFIIRPLIKNVMMAAPVPVRQLTAAQVQAGILGDSRLDRELTAPPEKPLTDAEAAKEMARADAKQFADVLRNWLK